MQIWSLLPFSQGPACSNFYRNFGAFVKGRKGGPCFWDPSFEAVQRLRDIKLALGINFQIFPMPPEKGPFEKGKRYPSTSNHQFSGNMLFLSGAVTRD